MSKFNVGLMMVLAGADLGAAVSAGVLRQVGVIRTRYKEVDINGESKDKGISIEAVLECLTTQDGFSNGEFYAVEVHRGVALVNPVVDEEMAQAFSEQVAMLDAEQIRLGTHFVYDQEMTTTQEFINDAA